MNYLYLNLRVVKNTSTYLSFSVPVIRASLLILINISQKKKNVL